MLLVFKIIDVHFLYVFVHFALHRYLDCWEVNIYTFGICTLQIHRVLFPPVLCVVLALHTSQKYSANMENYCRVILACSCEANIRTFGIFTLQIHCDVIKM